MTTSTPEKQDGLKALNDAIEIIQSKIVSLGGVFEVQMAVSYVENPSLNLSPSPNVLKTLKMYKHFSIHSRKL